MTYSNARQNFSSVLDRAKKDGAVRVTRADGSNFKIIPEEPTTSPFDGIGTNIYLQPGQLQEGLADSKEYMNNRY